MGLIAPELFVIIDMFWDTEVYYGKEIRMARFYPLFSGSSGNSTYMGTATEGILIDCGMSAKQLNLALEEAEIAPHTIRAVFITHEHIDHIRGLRVFAKKYGCPVYASPGTLKQLLQMGQLDGVTDYRPIGEAGVELQTMRITSFPTSHDAAESVGYRIEFADGRAACVATDTGMITPAILQGLRGADLVLLESNHDPRMLRYGPYPAPLKARIASELGHLSNTDCAAAAVHLLENGTARFVLGHLSRENNTPETAREATLAALTADGGAEGMDFLLQVAAPRGDGKLMVF